MVKPRLFSYDKIQITNITDAYKTSFFAKINDIVVETFKQVFQRQNGKVLQ